jgi:hypothetical protein
MDVGRMTGTLDDHIQHRREGVADAYECEYGEDPSDL